MMAFYFIEMLSESYRYAKAKRSSTLHLLTRDTLLSCAHLLMMALHHLLTVLLMRDGLLGLLNGLLLLHSLLLRLLNGLLLGRRKAWPLCRPHDDRTARPTLLQRTRAKWRLADLLPREDAFTTLTVRHSEIQ